MAATVENVLRVLNALEKIKEDLGKVAKYCAVSKKDPSDVNHADELTSHCLSEIQTSVGLNKGQNISISNAENNRMQGPGGIS